MDGGCRVPPPLWFVWPSHVHLSSHFAASCHAAKRRWRGKLSKQSMATRYIHTCSFPLLSCTYPFLREDVDSDNLCALTHPPTMHFTTDVSQHLAREQKTSVSFSFSFSFLILLQSIFARGNLFLFFLSGLERGLFFFNRYNLAPKPGHSVSQSACLALLVRLLDLLCLDFEPKGTLRANARMHVMGACLL